MPHPQTLPSCCLPTFTSTARAVLGLLLLVPPWTAPSACSVRAGSQGIHTGCSATSPHKQLVALLFVQHSSTNWKSPQDPLHRFTGFSVLPEVRKAAARERRRQSQYTLLYLQDSSAPKVPSNKGHKLHDGKIGVTALRHSACPLPLSPT